MSCQAQITGNILDFHAFGVASCRFLYQFFAATFENIHNVSGMSQEMSFVCFDTRRIQMWNQNFCISNIRADAPKIQTLKFVIDSIVFLYQNQSPTPQTITTLLT